MNIQDGVQQQQISTDMQKFKENYDMYETLGSGVYCVVRRVVRKQTQQVYAAKMYRNALMRGKNEIDLLIRLDHPNIVNIYEYYQDEGTLILILDYMAGGQLYPHVAQRQYLTEVDVIGYMKKLVDAVRYCHELKVVHRDIKPQNLLVSSRGPDYTIKLADFGISKILSEEMLITNCGTPVFMAPELWARQAYTEKVDIWALGIVMYYLLSGEYPFQADNESDLEKLILNDEVAFPQKEWALVSQRAKMLIINLLEKDPQKRPSAGQINEHIAMNATDRIVSPQKRFMRLQAAERKINTKTYIDKKKRVKKQVKLKMNQNIIQIMGKSLITFLVAKGNNDNNNCMDVETTYQMELNNV